MIRVILGDDHMMFCEGIRTILERDEMEILGTAENGQDLIRLARNVEPDVVITDMAMPVMNGLTAAREIRRHVPKARTILLTMFDEDTYVLEALKAGVRGYVLKAQAAEELVSAIRSVMRGSIYLSPSISQTVVDAYLNKTDMPYDPLTDREQQVLQLVAEGNTTKEVARVLGVSVKTAESHRTRIMQKLDIHDTAGMVRCAIRRGIVRP